MQNILDLSVEAHNFWIDIIELKQRGVKFTLQVQIFWMVWFLFASQLFQILIDAWKLTLMDYKLFFAFVNSWWEIWYGLFVKRTWLINLIRLLSLYGFQSGFKLFNFWDDFTWRLLLRNNLFNLLLKFINKKFKIADLFCFLKWFLVLTSSFSIYI